MSEKAVELPVLAGYGKARPVDEATRDPSLAAFRDTLLDIARRRDSAALAARLAPTIKFSFGDSDGGPAAFLAQWSKNQSMDKLWMTLTDVLEHGGRMQDSASFMAPWTFTRIGLRKLGGRWMIDFFVAGD